jgi:hypothetical protein
VCIIEDSHAVLGMEWSWLENLRTCLKGGWFFSKMQGDSLAPNFSNSPLSDSWKKYLFTFVVLQNRSTFLPH